MVSGDFTDDELNAINSFVNEATALPNKIPQVSIKVRYDNNKLTFPCELPDWNEIRLLLYLLRPFQLQKEKTSFNRVCNILSMKLKADAITTLIDKLKDLYIGKKCQSELIIRRQLPAPDDSDFIILNSEKVLNTFLNAYEYHRDEDKRKKIDFILKPFPDDFSKAVFAMLVTDKQRAVIYLAFLIKEIQAGNDIKL